MSPLGTLAPDFALPDTTGRLVRASDYTAAPALLVMFICNHCPYVKHVQAELARLGRDYQARGVAVLAISANDIHAYPQDGPAEMAAVARTVGYTFPYLYDESQAIARAYRAACTPDFFLYDVAQRLVYRGQLDDSRPGSELPVNGRDLRAALDAVLAGRPVSRVQKPSLGCNIKWKPDQEPEYYAQ